LILIACSVSKSSAQSHSDEASSSDEDIFLPPWWSSVFGVKPRSLRADRGKDERFWATRGKRSGLLIKPNGLFQPIKWKKATTLKPNGFFMMGKRSSFKPNSLFSMTRGRRSFMKPNGLFSPLESYGGKRSISLKPNGLFSLTKRSDHQSLSDEYPSVSMELYDRFWGMPMGIYGPYKRSLGDYDEFDYEDEENDIEDDEDYDLSPVKREASTFWATRGKKDGNMFWATRGKRGENFWAVRG